MGVDGWSSWGTTLLAASFATGCGLFPDLDQFTSTQAQAQGPVPRCAMFADPQYLKAAAPATSAGFGTLLAMEGDTLVVGAPVEGITNDVVAESPAPNAECPPRTLAPDALGTGRLHPFARSGSSWNEEPFHVPGAEQIVGAIPGSLVSTDPIFALNDFTTISLALSNGRLVVGHSGDFDDPVMPVRYRGSFRIFERGTEGWSQVGVKVEPATAANDGFGASVAVSGDVLVVGAPGTLGFRGAVYVYDISDPSNPILNEVIVSPNPEDNALFGGKVAVNESWIIVGAPGESASTDFTVTGVGAVYPFSRKQPRRKPVPLYPSFNNPHAFGVTIVLDGDTLLVGAPASSGCTGKPAFADAGVVQTFELSPSGTTWTEGECISAAGDQAELFGFGLSMSRDWLAVAAPFSWSRSPGLSHGMRPLLQNTGAGAGLVYMYERRGNGFVPSCFLEAPNADPCDTFGEAVAIGGDSLAVGAFGEDGKNGMPDVPGTPLVPDTENQLMDSGAVYLYGLPGSARSP